MPAGRVNADLNEHGRFATRRRGTFIQKIITRHFCCGIAEAKNNMDHQKPSTALFDVYLRLRPSTAERERFLDVEPAAADYAPTHITIKPPADDKRKRAVEKFAFTRVFEEDAGQVELFHETGAPAMIEGVLGAQGREGRDGLLATLGVTGSGKVWIAGQGTENTETDEQ